MKQKKDNISEYIIQLYKDEDLVRAFDFDLEKIGNHVVNHLPISNIEKLPYVNYYEEMIEKMKAQNIEKSGHLKEANKLIIILESLHKDLKKSDTEYQKIYKSTSPYINKNIVLSKHSITNEIQICINGIYGFLLLKLNGKKLDDSDREAVEFFGDLLSYLSVSYKKITGK